MFFKSVLLSLSRYMLVLGLSTFGMVQADQAKSTLNLAVFKHTNTETTLKHFQPLADYLSQALPNHQVKLYAMGDSELRTVIEFKQVDLVIANPFLYQTIRHETPLNKAIATLQTAYKNKILNTYGGVIFTRADHEDIQTLNELAQKTIAISSFRSSGGFIMPMAEIVKHTKLRQPDLNFITVHDHEHVIKAVLSGKADVGFVRSGILEQWISEGKLSPLDFKVIHSRNLFNYPFQLSTTLYPEVPFVVLSHVDDATTKQIATALYQLTPDHPIAKRTQIAGFIPPLDYLPFEKILRDLQLEPFNIPPKFSFKQFWQQYTLDIILGGSLIAILILSLLRTVYQNQQIIKHQQQYERLVDEIGENYCLYSLDAQGIITYISDSAAGIFEIPVSQILHQHWKELLTLIPEEEASVEEYIESLLQKQQSKNEFSLRFDSDSGKRKTLKLIQHATLNKFDKLISIDGLIENITEQTETENELRQAASVFTHAQEAILITDPSGVILNVNQAFEYITGYQKTEALGNTPKLLNSGKQDKAFYENMWHQLIKEGKWAGEIWNKRKDGRIYPEKLTISAIYNEDNSVKNYIALFSDITVEKEQRSQLELIAHYDMLTGLPNRMLFADRLNQAIASTKRHGTSIAVLFIDLDGFKAVNDQHGHQAGDYLLKTIGRRFKSAIRDEDSISRYGGDEFVAVILNADQLKTLTPLLQRFLDHANEPIVYEDMTFSVSASIGVTFYHHYQDLDAEQVIRQADQAMYQAKTRGKNQTFVFDQSQTNQAASAEILTLQQAMNDNEFRLYYQPKVNLKTGELYGLEALIRWQHLQKGLLPPSEFVHLFKDPALAFDAGFWVIEAALKQMQVWLEQGNTLPVSVNIDGTLLLDQRFSNHLQALLDQYHQIPPSMLTFEILETSVIEDIVSTTKVMKQCTAMGIQFAIDDFGTGYASLTYLKTLPVHELKADLSFVKDLQTDPQSLSIMESIIAMGNAFNLHVVAEGVETEHVASLLLQLGYELIQGYEISRPMPADQVLDWLSQWHTKSIWQHIQPATEDELVFITAAIEHRAWVHHIETYLTNRVDWPPEMNVNKCQLSKWFSQKHVNQFLSESQFQQIQSLHSQLHALGQQLIEKKAQGDLDSAKHGLEKLHELKGELLKAIDDAKF